MLDINSLLNQGIGHHQTGNLAGAAKCYATVLQADPNIADAWHLSGLVAHQFGNSNDGLRHIQHAIELNPDNAEYHSNLASIWRAQKNPVAARRSAEKALQIAPGFAPALYQRGLALLELSQVDEAVRCFKQAENDGFCTAQVALEIGMSLQYIGDAAGSIQYLEKSLEQNPDQPQIYFNFANLVRNKHYEFNDSQRSQMVRLLSKFQKHPNSLSRIHFALAVDCETAGRYKEAFDHYQLANEFHCQLISPSNRCPSRSLRQVVDEQIERFGPNAFFDPEPTNAQCSQPIFVVGMPRSGTTLVAQMLGSHHLVESAGELMTMGNLVGEISSQFQLSSSGGPTAQSRNLIRNAALTYIDDVVKLTSGAKFVVDKMPDNFRNLGFIANMFPEAKVIHCRRDPRDNCVSAFCQLFKSERLQFETGDLARLGKNYSQYRRLMRHWNRVLPISVHDVFYEQLVDAPEPTVRGMLDYAGLEWNDDCLNFHRQTTAVRTASSLQVRRTIHTSSSGKWQRFESHLGPLIAALGNSIREYESEMPGITSPSKRAD